MNGIDQLCPNCGLCCDSTLFADVELQKSDAAKRLKKLGLALWKKGQGRLAFSQPCACFDGKLCRIYEDRPHRCRKFECGLLKKVEADELTVNAALKKISNAKLKAKKIRGLLNELGNQDESSALTHRYADAMSAPVDLANERDAELRGELMLAVGELMQSLQRDFLR